jgi:dihydroorotase
MIGDGSLLEAFENLARIGARCVIHAENGSIIENRTARLKSAGRTDGRAHAESRPQVCAVEAVSRSIVLAEATGAPIHIAHESTGAALDVISKAKSRGINVTVETCPQYLLLSEDDLARAGGIFRCNPPLRQNEDQQRLWRGIRDGEIDVIATDHAPHTQKQKLNSNIWQCQCGMLGVETAMSLMLTEVASQKLTIADYVRLSATNPAKIWGLYPKKGTIKVGSDADIVIVDLEATARIDQERLHSKNKISAWHGRRVQGIPTTTIVRGKIVVREGQLVGERGWGRYVQQIRS